MDKLMGLFSPTIHKTKALEGQANFLTRRGKELTEQLEPATANLKNFALKSMIALGLPTGGALAADKVLNNSGANQAKAVKAGDKDRKK